MVLQCLSTTQSLFQTTRIPVCKEGYFSFCWKYYFKFIQGCFLPKKHNTISLATQVDRWAYMLYILQEVPSPENAGVHNIQEII